MAKFHYLDLDPESLRRSDGATYQRAALLKWGPKSCFCQEDLYTIQFGRLATDVIEHRLFGPIDSAGRKAVEFFSDYHWADGASDAFQALISYMDAQRLRTPRGLDHLRRSYQLSTQTITLMVMQQIRMFHATMWAEAVWEVVGADKCDTGFLLTDEPVTFYNAKAFPNSPECRYPNDVSLQDIGTRTIFPLGLRRCLILTHLQLTRDPWINPRRPRANARAFQTTFKKMTDIQTGRQLGEEEVIRINLILKRRATRYVAAAQEQWLYPESQLKNTHWSKLDNDWFLFPNLVEVPFTSEIIIGFEGGGGYAQDEYGRRPSNPKYRDKKLHEQEWIAHQRALEEWTYRRQQKPVGHAQESVGGSGSYDRLVQLYLRQREERRKNPRK